MVQTQPYLMECSVGARRQVELRGRVAWLLWGVQASPPPALARRLAGEVEVSLKLTVTRM